MLSSLRTDSESSANVTVLPNRVTELNVETYRFLFHKNCQSNE